MNVPLSESPAWPTEEQRLLLRAVLSERDPALDAWQQWASKKRTQGLDLGSARLLGFLYQRLTTFGEVDHPLLPSLQRRYRLIFLKNEMLLSGLGTVLSAFHQENIQTMALKGSALIPLYYKDAGLREMDDADVLISPKDVERAIRILASSEWTGLRKPTAFSPSYLLVKGAHNFHKPGKLDVDLHWRLLAESTGDEVDEDFWKAAQPLEISGVRTHALSAEDQLLHVCAHGLSWNWVAPIRWIADAMTVLRATPSFDWNRLVAQTQQRRITVVLFWALQYLKNEFAAPVPASVFDALDEKNATDLERREFRARLSPPGRLGALPALWWRYRTYTPWGRAGGWRAAVRFPRYVQLFNEIPSLAGLPLFSVKRFLELNRQPRPPAANGPHETA